MRWTTLGACAAATLVAATPQVFSAEVVYDCTATYRSPDNWTPSRIVFFLDEAKAEARVLDGLTQSIFGGPIEVALEQRSETSYTLRWTVDEVPSQNSGSVKVRYKAILHPAKGRFSVGAVAGGFDNDPRSEGRCKRVE